MTHQTLVLPIMCSDCLSVTTFNMEPREVKGCTYDCKCGRVMIINDDLSTISLSEKMRQDMIKRGIAVTDEIEIQSIEL